MTYLVCEKQKTEEQAVFKIEEITDEDINPRPAGDFSVGTILMKEDGSWIAACPSQNFQTNGVGPFANLSTDILWMVNQPYDVVGTLKDANKDLQLTLSGWMRIELQQAAEEWGFPKAATDLQTAEMLATVMERVLRVSLEAIQGSRMAKNVNVTTILKRILRSPSLATGLRNIVSNAMDATAPKQNKVRRAISETMVYGASNTYAQSCEEKEMLLTCRIPRVTHAYRVSREKVPEAGQWQKVTLSEGASIEEVLPQMKAVGRPMVLYGTAKQLPGQSHEYYDLWVKPNNSAIKRLAYTLEEVEALLPRYTFTDFEIFVAPGWKSSITGHLIDCLLQSTGGRKVASASWSVGVAAENILCAGMRRAGFKAEDTQPPESPWLLVHDRLAMREPVEMLLDSGATFVSAYAGGITVKVAKDPEIISMMCNIMWDAGLVVSVGTARKLSKMGVHLPAEAQTFGGAQEDAFSAIPSHSGKRNIIWRLDEIIDQPPGERAHVYSQMFS